MTQTVFIVDDDPAVRDALHQQLTGAGFLVQTFGDGRSFLDSIRPEDSGCVVLDMAMPGMTGMEVQAALSTRGIQLPVIFLTAFGDIPLTVNALKGGAMDFLEKPTPGPVLVGKLREALALDAKRRREIGECRATRERYEELTDREKEILHLVVRGQSSKKIAQRLGISHRTVEVHRTHIMLKMGAGSVAELAGMATACGLTGA